jgi:predicted HTH domain antitoxin
MQISPLRIIANELPFFSTADEREKLLGVVGALVLRRISLSKASELMGMERDSFAELLTAMRVDYSYLDEQDIETERNWQ